MDYAGAVVRDVYYGSFNLLADGLLGETIVPLARERLAHDPVPAMLEWFDRFYPLDSL